MKWEYHHKEEGTTGVFHLIWEEWTAGPYKIVSYDRPGVYYAYYYDQHVGSPPNIVECAGCGDTHCTGYHKAWTSLDQAQQDCEDHAVRMRVDEYSRELPW